MKPYPIPLSNSITWIVTICCIAIGMVDVGYAERTPNDVVLELHKRGIEAYNRGDFPVCIDLWKQARETAGKARLVRVEVAILVNMAQAHHSMGNPALAFHTLDDAEELAEELNDRYLRLQIRGVRAAVATSGNDSRSPAVSRVPSSEQSGESPTLEWAQAQMDELLTKLQPPNFSAPPTLEEWSTANEYFKARPGILRSKVDDSPSLKTVRMLEDALELAEARNYLDASEIIEFELGKDRKSAPRDAKVRKLYASLTAVFSQRKQERLALLCKAEVDRLDASNAVGVTEPEVLHASASTTRQGGRWRDLFQRPETNGLTGRDLQMMQVIARGEFFRLLKRAAAHFALLAEQRQSRHRAEGLKAIAAAAEISETQFDSRWALEVKRVFGAWLAVPGFEEMVDRKPEHHLFAAWAAAQKKRDKVLEASVLNDLGVSFSTRDATEMGVACFDRAARLAKRSGDSELLSRSLLNRARANGELAALERAEAQISQLPSSHTKSQMLVSAGQLFAERGRLKNSYQNAKAALTTARQTKDLMATSNALGLLGNLYHSQGRNDEALALSRRALKVAQDESLRSQDLSFRWTWQIGRVLKAKGQLQDALESYHRAQELLATIRQDTVSGYGRRGDGSGFRKEIGPFYFELAEFAFAEARREAPADAHREASLRRARATIEEFKAALLEDYFQDRSITTYRQTEGITSRSVPRRSVSDVARLSETPTAVFYFIPLEKRTEILVEVDQRLYWHTTEIGRGALETLTNDLRQALDPMVSSEDTTHIEPARLLYDALIAPFEGQLEKHAVETLVIVPEGMLRSIPIGALHDGNRFLIERFSLATVPDLLLMDDSDRKPLGVERPLLAGLSESVQGFAALPGVSAEIENLGSQFQKHAAKSLVNEDFTNRSFRASFRKNFDLVHLASHANFSSDLNDTFVLTHEDRIGLADLEGSVRQLAFRERPLDLLVLSACETAVGNDRAALGLAGVAVKSGAHSVVASLWAVDDNATGALVKAFYQNFLPQQLGLSKAQALQRAQLHVMNHPAQSAWKHPKFWAPFTVIGNWLAPEERLRVYKELDLKIESNNS